MAVLSAERIKITTTKSPLWCSVIIVVLALGFAAIMGTVAKSALTSDAQGAPELDAALATAGISGFGIMVLMIMAALAITSEYRFGTIRTTFQAVPNRASVLAAKAGLIGGFGAVLTFVLAFGAYAMAKVLAGADASVGLTLSSSSDWRAMYGIPIYAFFCVVLAVGVGAIIRQSAGAIALLLLWPLLIESLFSLFGSFGEKIMPFLPFNNANHFLSPEMTTGDFHWGPWGSLIYFAVFVLVIFGISIVLVNRRDA
ncbi:ABC transporter permease [Rhodococcus sp. ACPA4]|jgi:ABC-2 type transport system permease protein|uniref:ABC-2 type transport system permease protein n=2 Tax=Nocardiaceae TaxID=85025 RepID=A0A652YVY8_NOCGL|nr:MULTISPECIES: ABC transporter permease subunit [Rhodococcus]NMD59745.1 ABC transporter permease subunit [Nocardia globerula]KJF23297.1 ABC-2 family transporter protein [Rhodococcus sp. AD45]MCE4265022.1 ABC transporter permease subunit [Rhodococcus globerulus]MDV6268270.1 ABC transporter permease subunit [Rhodococcus globerulus]NRI66786.1 ABC transporter permease [Rhodococcus sp. MS16]